MTKHEVQLWIDYHHSVFPEWSYCDAPSKEARNIAFAVIAKALYKVDLADASRATDSMFAGEVKKPFHASDHLAAIVAACRAMEADRKPRRSFTVDGRETFTCPHCQGFGHVIVRHPKYEPRGVAIACCCRPDNGRARYDPERMERVDPLPLPGEDIPWNVKTRQYAANIGRMPG